MPLVAMNVVHRYRTNINSLYNRSNHRMNPLVRICKKIILARMRHSGLISHSQQNHHHLNPSTRASSLCQCARHCKDRNIKRKWKRSPLCCSTTMVRGHCPQAVIRHVHYVALALCKRFEVLRVYIRLNIGYISRCISEKLYWYLKSECAVIISCKYFFYISAILIFILIVY